ncbi:hypothetical protein ABH935_006420 [Catenulispora sp. GAS73]|uniref:condensation domain-containing protein n=1 Tax=Catenulispora sp. GAS73 TaxID=3156269 RepID=UPI0035176F14
MIMGRAAATPGPTSLVEEARLTGEFDGWHNLVFCAVWLTGGLDLPAVRDAWRALCLRHDVMRRAYASPDDAWTYDDVLSDVEFHTADTDTEAIEVMHRILGTPFRLDAVGLSRIVVVRRDDRRHLFGIALDHIITDHSSWGLLVKEFGELYARAVAGEAITSDSVRDKSYQNYATLLRHELTTQWGYQRKAFWLSYTEAHGLYPPLFPSVGEPSAEPSLNFVEQPLPADLSVRVGNAARYVRATSSAVVNASVLAALQEVSGATDVGLDTVHHGRLMPGTSAMLGQFALGAPLRLRNRRSDPLETVREVFTHGLDVFEHLLPLQAAGRYWNEELVSMSRGCDVHVTLNQKVETMGTSLLAGTRAEFVPLEMPVGTFMSDSLIFAWRLDDSAPHVSVRYDENMFSRDTVAALVRSAEGFLQAAGSGA